MISKFFSMVVVSTLFATPILAEGDHGIATIHTADIDLTYIDHVLAGRIGEFPVFAVPLNDEFGMTLQHRAGGQDFESIFRAEDSSYHGTVSSIAADGATTIIVFNATSISGAAGEIKGFLNDKPMLIKVTSEVMNGNHYVNPQFDIQVGEKTYQFTLDGGEACIGCSTKISFAVVTMLAANGIL